MLLARSRQGLRSLITARFERHIIERNYAKQVLRFAEKIQYDLYYKGVRYLVSQISLIEKLTVAD